MQKWEYLRLDVHHALYFKRPIDKKTNKKSKKKKMPA
jgi:hypothetical protein